MSQDAASAAEAVRRRLNDIDNHQLDQLRAFNGPADFHAQLTADLRHDLSVVESGIDVSRPLCTSLTM
jgi:hypothetical protein